MTQDELKKAAAHAALDHVVEGSIVQLRGYLVAVQAADGWRWRSSLSRDDTGGGSCELVFVEYASVREVP